jgi:hypothetical protein
LEVRFETPAGEQAQVEFVDEPGAKRIVGAALDGAWLTS